MLRWVLLLVLLGCVYWIYERDYLQRRRADRAGGRRPRPGPRLPPGGRLGGGLNPFVTDTDIDAPPQRPKAPLRGAERLSPLGRECGPKHLGWGDL